MTKVEILIKCIEKEFERRKLKPIKEVKREGIFINIPKVKE